MRPHLRHLVSPLRVSRTAVRRNHPRGHGAFPGTTWFFFPTELGFHGFDGCRAAIEARRTKFDVCCMTVQRMWNVNWSALDMCLTVRKERASNLPDGIRGMGLLMEGAARAVHAVHMVHQGTCVWPHP